VAHAILRRFIEGQKRLSMHLESRIPERFRIDGNRDFVDRFVPQYLHEGATLYDVGGGKNPFVRADVKARLRLEVVGLDIDSEELARAPAGIYDRTICADVTRYRGRGDADLVVCQALLEHVPDTGAALDAISSILRPGGVALLFVPSRNALFARLNRVLPEQVKRELLFRLHPGARRRQGFPAYYDRCTPRDMSAMAADRGLQVRELRVYFASAYFTFFFPLHAAWRIWVWMFEKAAGEQAAESFSMALVKRPPAHP